MSESLHADVPPAVRDAGKKADEAIRALREAAEAAAKNPNEQAQPAAQEAQQPPQEAQPAPAQEAQPAPAQEAQPAPSADAARIAQLEQDVRTWRGRAESANRALTDMRNKVDSLTATVSELEAKVAAPAAPALPAASALTQEELDEFGPDLLEAARRHVMAQVSPTLEAALAKVAALEAQLKPVQAAATTAARSAEELAIERFYGALNSGLPGWEAIDSDPAFRAWAGEYDPLIGRTRTESLDDAVKARDSARVIAFFKAFASQRGAPAPQGGTSSPASPGAAPGGTPAAAPESNPPLDLADLAAPGKARSAAPDMGGKRIWNLSEIRAHTAKIGRGGYRGNEAEKDRIDREIAQAQMEGRVDMSR